eukprot:CAMPEP_0182798814 /NCGR_PEP_ID=MMETSP0006_2-20121128/1550_1 /TAXON_ID=97485 /ORGANISM="Prymnesium parvum, Strain Texoma1" /LENGTH=57 /DNA_ID=CAMNT_0024923955 /DNA_START=404 /DNA_END=575 /DNA_ORIENTATION=-
MKMGWSGYPAAVHLPPLTSSRPSSDCKYASAAARSSPTSAAASSNTAWSASARACSK